MKPTGCGACEIRRRGVSGSPASHREGRRRAESLRTDAAGAGQHGNAFDREEIDFHGYTFSHLDALCHVSHEGKLYNGFDFKEIVSQKDGCAKLGITNARDKVVTRGVLIDIPRLRAVSSLEPGTHVYREDIEAWERKASIKVGAGDAIFLRTGRWAHSSV